MGRVGQVFPKEILEVAASPFSAEVEVLLAPFGGVLECPEEFWQTVAVFPFFGGVVVVLGLFFVVECSSSLSPSSAVVVVWELEEMVELQQEVDRVVNSVEPV